jgi:hypothetical protein
LKVISPKASPSSPYRNIIDGAYLKRTVGYIPEPPASCNRKTRLLDYTVNTQFVPGPWMVIIKNPALSGIVGVR